MHFRISFPLYEVIQGVDIRLPKIASSCRIESDGDDVNFYLFGVKPDPEQLPPPAPQDVQPEGQRVGGAEEPAAVACTWADIKEAITMERERCVELVDAGVSNGFEREKVRYAILDRQQPVAAGAPLSGAGDEEMPESFWDAVAPAGIISVETLKVAENAWKLQREAVAAERERCAKVAETAPVIWNGGPELARSIAELIRGSHS